MNWFAPFSDLISCLALLTAFCIATCFPQSKALGGVDLVQLTDLHLFGGVSENDRALRACIAEINRELVSGKPVNCVVVTGDLGLQDLIATGAAGHRTVVANAEDLLTTESKKFADIVATSRVKTWLFLPGNNDLIDENPESLRYFSKFLADVSSDIGGTINIVNLAAGGRAAVYEIGNLSIIGFNNASFKSNNNVTDSSKFAESQLAALSELDSRVSRANYAYIFYHVPEIDDPYLVRTNPALAKTFDKDFRYSAWTVKPAVRQAWNNIISRENVRGLFAGHFHDYHRDTYQNYHWVRTLKYAPASLIKLYLCPPVAIKNQERIEPSEQARGYRRIHIDDTGSVRSQIVWMTSNAFIQSPALSD
ncbi:MAG TPA: metallophosphoesterase [Pirellulales bacterium]|jgi:hypothetical protein